MDKERDFCLKCQEWAFCQLESAWRSSPNTKLPPDCRFAEPQEPEKSVHPVEPLNATIIPDNSGSGPVVSSSTEMQSPNNTPYVPRENHPWRMGTGEERPKREPRKSSVARRTEPDLSIKTAMTVVEENSSDDLFDRFVKVNKVPYPFHPFVRVVLSEHQAFSASAAALGEEKSEDNKLAWHQLIEDAFREGFPDLDPKRNIEIRAQASILAKRAALFE